MISIAPVSLAVIQWLHSKGVRALNGGDKVSTGRLRLQLRAEDSGILDNVRKKQTANSELALAA